jgi:2-polyprenyl-3-methyl-5-hydroxy-6-metoxy-1,4-benzoquinol methylase
MMGGVGGGGGGSSFSSAARVLGAGRALLWRMVQDQRQQRHQQHLALTATAGVASSAAAASQSPSPSPSAAAADAQHHHHPETTTNDKSLDAREARKFGALADKWWDADLGPFAPLHSMNPARVSFIRDAVLDARRERERAPAAATAATAAATEPSSSSAAEPLANLRILDVGCGGGILSEALARLGARVVGIDAAREGVRAAQAHAALDPRVRARVCYRAATAERLLAELTGAEGDAGDGGAGATNAREAAAADDAADEGPGNPCLKPFDVVVASEVIEHVRDPAAFLSALAALSRPRTGQVVISTLNRTAAALALAVVGAEHVAGLVPVGTHDWRRFLTPQELAMLAEGAGLEVAMMAGMVPDLRAGAGALAAGRGGGGGTGAIGALLGKWRLSSTDLRINYIALLQRKD